MQERNVKQWLEAWVEQNNRLPHYIEPVSDIRIEADICRDQAASVGIAANQLEAAAGGSLADYIAKEQRTTASRELAR